MRSPAAHLADIVEAIGLVQVELAESSLEALAGDRRRQWIVERGIEIVSEASRRLPDDMKARHPTLPWRKIANVGNVLRHEYASIAYDILWRVVQDDLPPLLTVCSAELAVITAETNPNGPEAPPNRVP